MCIITQNRTIVNRARATQPLPQIGNALDIPIALAMGFTARFGKKSTDVQGDWARLEEYLRQCYASIQRELAAW